MLDKRETVKEFTKYFYELDTEVLLYDITQERPIYVGTVKRMPDMYKEYEIRTIQHDPHHIRFNVMLIKR